MEKTYYYRVGDQQIGPVSLDQMRGAVSLDTYVWAEGMPNWVQISQLPEVMQQLGLGTSQYEPQAQPETQYAQPSYQQPQPSTNAGINNATNGTQQPKPNTYLVLSIVSVVLSCLIGIVALVFSILADSDYKKGAYQDAVSKAKVAKIVAIVGIVLGGLYWLFTILYFIFFAAVAVSSGAVNY